MGEHGGCQPRVGAQENGLVHDFVGTFHLTHHAKGIGTIFSELNEDRLTEEITPEEHTIANLIGVQVAGQIGVAERRGGLYPQHKTEPRGIGAATGRIPGEAILEAQCFERLNR